MVTTVPLRLSSTNADTVELAVPPKKPEPEMLTVVKEALLPTAGVTFNTEGPPAVVVNVKSPEVARFPETSFDFTAK